MNGRRGQAVERGAEGTPLCAVPGPAGQTTASATAPARGSAATYALAGVIAVAACLIFLIPLSLIAAARAGGLYFGYGNPARLLLLLAGAVAVAGLVTAAVIAAVASRTRGQQPSKDVAQAPTPTTRRRVVLLGVAVALVVGASLVGVYSGRLAGLFLTFEPVGLGYGVLGKLAVVWAAVVATVGIVAAAIVVAAVLLPGRATSLRTRTFGVIVIVVLIPSLCLAGLGAWAYYRSWNVATSIAHDQSNYRAGELAREIRSVQRQPGRFGPADRAKLADAIAQMYAWSHPEGAQLATLSQIRQTRTLPVWAIRDLERRGYVIGDEKSATGVRGADIVAWRVGPSVVRYFVPVPGAYDFSSPPVPVDRLIWIGVSGVALIIALGLLGAWLLSRTVVRPVRRLAQASGRLAEGEAGVTVTPEGPKELRELAVSFNDMNAKLTKAQETEQAFLLSVSHELKTPLTSIRGYAEGIGDGTVSPDEGADVIGAESSRLERLVGDLLESGRMRKAAFTVRREAVDLAAVVEDVARRYEGTAREAGLTLLINTEADGGAVADHDRVLQVVSNLVENAIRCTLAPGTVTITTAPGSITVADTGRGLTSDDLPRAFERFYLYTRYGTDRPVGTGLGLAIVKELTEAMGGTVSVSSAVGVGTAFTVALPADSSAAVPVATPVGPIATQFAPATSSAATAVPAAAAAPPADTAATAARPAVPAGSPDPAAPAAPQDDAS